MLENHDPQQFRTEFEAAREEFEEFCSDILMHERCHVAVEMQKPAAMYLERPAIKKFGQRFADPRFRQCFGHVIRFMMEKGLGYELDEPEVRFAGGVYLTRGARYRVAVASKPKKLTA